MNGQNYAKKELMNGFKKTLTTLVTSIVFILFFAQKNDKFVLVIDPGHGGKDNGATYFGVKEKDVVLDVGLRLGEKIKKNHDDVKVIYTRTTDEFIELYRRAKIANENKADLFLSIHCNGARNSSAYGTETFVLGVESHRSNANMEVLKLENSVIFLEDNYKEIYEGYDPNSPESVIGMTLMKNVHLDNSLKFATLMEQRFQADNRLSRGVKQAGFLVLVKTARPAVLVELGFLSNPEENAYLDSEIGRKEVTDALYDAFVKYKNQYDKKSGKEKKVEEMVVKEVPLQNSEYKVHFLTATQKYSNNSIIFRGLKDVETIFENGKFEYYYGSTKLNSKKEALLNEVKTAGFPQAKVVEIKYDEVQPNVSYGLELMTVKEKISEDALMFQKLRPVKREKKEKMFRYTCGNVKTIAEARKLLELAKKEGFAEAYIIKYTK